MPLNHESPVSVSTMESDQHLLNMRPEASREEFLVGEDGELGSLRRNRSKDFSEASFGWTFNARAVNSEQSHPIVGASRHSHGPVRH